MKYKSLNLALVVAFLVLLFSAGMNSAQAQRRGAAIDNVRLLTIKSPDAQMIALRTGQADYLPELIRPADIEALSREGYSVLSTPGFHMGFVGFNLRNGDQLEDVNVRHALFHAYNQEEIVASIYRYTVTPVQSLVPPSQGEWLNPALPKHPFNPGNKGDTVPPVPPADYPHSTFGIMAKAGYTYVGSGYGDTSAHWEKAGVSLPSWKFWTPTYEVAPTSAEHGARITEEWHKTGFNNIEFEPMDFNTYTSKVFDDHDFDIFMIFWRLGRFPTQLYDMTHSSMYIPGSDHAVGLNDPILDELVSTAVYSLDHDAQVAAAWEAEERLYDPAVSSQALPYMLLYSRVYFNAGRRYLTGVVNSPGYGSDNTWTWYNWRWNTTDGLRPGTGDSLVIYINGEEPDTLNILAQSTVYEANIVGPTTSGGIEVDPYTHGDVAWLLQEVPTQGNGGIVGPINVTLPGDINIVNGMKATYHIRPNLYWQDGNEYTSDDAIFSLNFLKNNQIPQYLSVWKEIEYINRVDSLTYEVYANLTSPFIVYDWDGGAFLLPPQVWGWLNGKPLATILSFEPDANTTDTGPWSYPASSMGPKTQLFGMGPYVFDLYDQSGMYADLHNWNEALPNVGYFKTTAEIASIKTELLHAVGDVDRNGWIWANDKYIFGQNFGKLVPPGNVDADLNGDLVIDWEDGAIIGAFWGKRKEYTQPV